ncbi:hypothetical protein G6F46_011095 [Rhizopus delemar]|nr:hypothetical protein G6F48_011356 [Rhizopus delemar]KAG1609038.1 hypothetical protein G6F46_011095 [Rhizopus delemar]
MALSTTDEPDTRSFKAAKRRFLQQNLEIRQHFRTSNQLSHCRRSISIDPILWLPISKSERSCSICWRLGWIPGGKSRPCPKRPMQQLSKNHAINCLDMHRRLFIPETVQDPLSFLLNILPLRPSISPPQVLLSPGISDGRLYVPYCMKTSVVERIDGKFNCPDCRSKLSTFRSFNNHVQKKHKGTCSTLSRAEKGRDLETDDDENTSSVLIKHHKPSKREIDFSVDNSVTFLTSTQFDDDTAVLLACNSLSSSPRIQDNCVLAAKIGKLKPILLRSSNGKIYPFLTASDNISDVLSDEPIGTWSLPTMNKTVTEDSSILTNADDLFKHIISTSPIYRHIADQQYVELSKQITQEINKDWAFFSQLRFATSQIFAGSILLSGSTALLIKCVESYGRLKTVDSRHERRTSLAAHQSSFPKIKSKYGQVAFCLTQDDNTTKLKIGATSCNLLVTSSMRLDKQTITNKTIEMGPNTSNFVPLPDAKVFSTRIT